MLRGESNSFHSYSLLRASWMPAADEFSQLKTDTVNECVYSLNLCPAKANTAGKQAQAKRNATCIDFSPGGDLIACGCDDGCVFLWSLQRQTCVCVIETTYGFGVLDVRCFFDGQHIVASYSDCCARVWHCATGKCVFVFSSPSAVTCLAASRLLPTMCIVANIAGDTYTFDVQTRTLTRVATGSEVCGDASSVLSCLDYVYCKNVASASRVAKGVLSTADGAQMCVHASSSAEHTTTVSFDAPADVSFLQQSHPPISASVQSHLALLSPQAQSQVIPLLSARVLAQCEVVCTFSTAGRARVFIPQYTIVTGADINQSAAAPATTAADADESQSSSVCVITAHHQVLSFDLHIQSRAVRARSSPSQPGVTCVCTESNAVALIDVCKPCMLCVIRCPTLAHVPLSSIRLMDAHVWQHNHVRVLYTHPGPLPGTRMSCVCTFEVTLGKGERMRSILRLPHGGLCMVSHPHMSRVCVSTEGGRIYVLHRRVHTQWDRLVQDFTEITRNVEQGEREEEFDVWKEGESHDPLSEEVKQLYARHYGISTVAASTSAPIDAHDSHAAINDTIDVVTPLSRTQPSACQFSPQTVTIPSSNTVLRFHKHTLPVVCAASRSARFPAHLWQQMIEKQPHSTTPQTFITNATEAVFTYSAHVFGSSAESGVIRPREVHRVSATDPLVHPNPQAKRLWAAALSVCAAGGDAADSLHSSATLRCAPNGEVIDS